MTATPQRRPAHLTLVELLIGVLLLAVAAFFVVRGMQQAKEREQLAAFTVALGKDDVDAVWKLCKANPKLVHANGGEYGLMALLLAARVGNKEMAQWLLDHGADVNAKNDYGRTPLHLAAANNRKEVAELLLAKGANINAKDAKGYTPLRLAAINGRKEVADLLRKHGAKYPESTPDAPAAEK